MNLWQKIDHKYDRERNTFIIPYQIYIFFNLATNQQKKPHSPMLTPFMYFFINFFITFVTVWFPSCNRLRHMGED